jgi:4-carboxymuconolactone decarboxylase
MARIATLATKDGLTADQQRAFEAIAQSRGRVVGPFTVLLHSPALAERTAHLGAHVRYESALPPAVRELAILAVARAMDCAFEWAAHVPEARRAGVREAAIAAVRDRAPAGLAPDEAAVVRYVEQLLGRHRVEEAVFRAVETRLGTAGVVELTAGAGYYAMLACTLNAFEVAPAAGSETLPA